MLRDRYLLFFVGHNIYTYSSKCEDWQIQPIWVDTLDEWSGAEIFAILKACNNKGNLVICLQS
jgi:hypothetical protein